ncbi:MAG: hypothetical protein ACUVX9_03280 [Anaerolineae bacterium]
MTTDYRSTVEGAQSGLERLVGSIPGYKGYKERELRREADKLLRTHLAGRLDEQRGRLVGLMGELTEAGRLSEITDLEKAVLRLQRLIDRLRTAAYGYAGLFDAVKVEQRQLDALYQFDLDLTVQVDQIAATVAALELKASQEESIGAETKALLGTLQAVNDLFGRRAEAITGQP